jgi:hypothetical protein
MMHETTSPIDWRERALAAEVEVARLTELIRIRDENARIRFETGYSPQHNLEVGVESKGSGMPWNAQGNSE